MMKNLNNIRKSFFHKKILLAYIMLLFVLSYITMGVALIEKPKVVYYEHYKIQPITVYKTKPIKFSKEEFITFLKDINIKYPEVVYAQAVIESGFKSKLFINNNNLFGMRVAKSRPTLASNKSSNYAHYNNWKESVIDYALYQSYFIRKIDSKEEYIEHLSNSYSEEKNSYIIKVRKISSEVAHYFR